MHDMKQNKKENGCERNFKGRFSEELPWRVVQQFTSEGPMNCFRKLPSSSPRRVVQYILLTLGSMFSRIKTFCFENSVLLHLA